MSNQPQPDKNENGRQECWTESIDSILVVVEGPGDTTRRPRRPNIPTDWPRETPPQPPRDDSTQDDQQKPTGDDEEEEKKK